MKMKHLFGSRSVLGCAAVMLGLLLSGVAFAQEAPIKVTSTVYPDGSHKDMQTNLGEKTAEAKTFDATGKITQRMTYTLDDKGLPKDGIAYSAKGTEIFRASYTRDSQDRISEERDFSSDGKLLRRLVYRFGSNGQVTGIDGFDGAGNVLPSTEGRSTKKPRR